MRRAYTNVNSSLEDRGASGPPPQKKKKKKNKSYIHSATDPRYASAPTDTTAKKVKRQLEKITGKTLRRKYPKGNCSQPLMPSSACGGPPLPATTGRKEPLANVGDTRNKIYLTYYHQRFNPTIWIHTDIHHYRHG